MSAEPSVSMDPLCRNCGAIVQTPYCGVCGQSTQTLARPFLHLARQVLGDLFNWDGRLWRSIVTLYTRPGQITQAYMAGRRASFTPPFRLYLLGVLSFLTLMGLSGITVFAVTLSDSTQIQSLSETPPIQGTVGGYTVGVELFRPAWEDPPTGITEEVLAQLLASDPAQPSPELQTLMADMAPVERLLMRALLEPDAIEQHLNIALAQALLFMVAGYALLNAALHPRAPLILHGIHSLYLHAAILPFMGLWALVSSPLSYLHPAASTLTIAVALVCLVIYAGWADRRVYGSSRIGISLRLPVLTAGYFLLYVIVTLAFASWSLI